VTDVQTDTRARARTRAYIENPDLKTVLIVVEVLFHV